MRIEGGTYMIQLAKYKHQKVMANYEELKNADVNETYEQHQKLLTDINWLLKNGKKFASNTVAFEKKMNSMKNAIEAKLDMQHEEGVTV